MALVRTASLALLGFAALSKAEKDEEDPLKGKCTEPVDDEEP